MRRLRLSTLLVVVNAGLLFLAVLGVAVAATRLLQRLADDQALARVEQAGLSARNVLDSAGHDTLTSAELLAQRPTLLRLVAARDLEPLNAFLAQFQETDQLNGIAVLDGGQVIDSTGVALDWPTIAAGRPTGEAGYFYETGADGGLSLVAQAPMPGRAGAQVLVAIAIDGAFVQRVSDDLGLRITIVSRARAGGQDALGTLQAQTLATATPKTALLAAPARYVALVPFGAEPGSVSGLVQAELDAAGIAGSVSRLNQGLFVVTLGVALFIATINFALGRRLGQPLQGLTNAAARIGYGDLATPVPPAQGIEMGMLAATLDEMRRRLLALTANLDQQQRESRAILSGIAEGVFAVDRERRIQYANPQMAALLGRPAESLTGRFCGDVLNPLGVDGIRPCEDNCPILHARFRSATRATEHLQLPGGERRVVVIASAAPEEQPATGSLRQVQIMRDETEVEAARRLRDAILANISHEFRTPLSAQLASIELLLDQLPDLSQDEIGTLVVSLQHGTLRLTHLIDNLLESVRIEAGQNAIRRQQVALDELIEQALEFTRPLLALRQQTVTLALPYPCPTVCGDGPRLTQVFVNLLANANKFAPAGSAIEIGGSVAEETVTLWVADQGPGLPQRPDQPLFIRFGRATPDEPDPGGVGLGLWLVKSIVERHGGRVEVDSSAAGTRMAVFLPITRPDEDPGG